MKPSIDQWQAISVLAYFSIGILYAHNSFFYRQWIKKSGKHLFSIGIFAIVPLFLMLLKPDLPFHLILLQIQAGLLFSHLLGLAFLSRYDAVKETGFFAIALAITGAWCMPFPPEQLTRFATHQVGLFLVVLCLILILAANFKATNKLERSPLAFFTAAGFSASFAGPSWLLFLPHAFFCIALYQWIKEQDKELENTLAESFDKVRAIEKDFKDAVRKEVNKSMFYHELSKDKMKAMAHTDDLTKSLNKKAMLNLCQDLITAKTPFALLMFDIDKFKTINDTLGHIVGDTCLKTMSILARKCIRDNDSLARFGGDEFVIVLPNSDLTNALRVAERFRHTIAQTENPHFTVSIGVSCYPFDGNDIKTLIHLADEGLYASKNNGRNLVTYKGKHAH